MKRHLFFLLVWVQLGYAQTHIYQHFGVDEGLPSSEVYDVYQDTLGYIWFATDKGLSRYNGYEFENFTSKDGLPGNTVLDFYPQDNGTIFCIEYHSNTLFYFDEVFNGFKLYPYNEMLQEHIPSNAVVKSINLDENGTLTVGGYSMKGFVQITSDGALTKIYEKDVLPNVSFPQRKPHLKLGILNLMAYYQTIMAPRATS